MLCKNCGKELVGAGIFCQSCGARQESVPQPGGGPLPPQGAPHTPPAYRGAPSAPNAPQAFYRAAPAMPAQRPARQSLASELGGYWLLLLMPFLAHLLLPVLQNLLAQIFGYPIISAVNILITLFGGLATSALVYAGFTRSIAFGLLWQAPKFLYQIIFAPQIFIHFFHSLETFFRFLFIPLLLPLLLWGMALLIGRAGGRAARVKKAKMAAVVFAVWLVNKLAFASVFTFFVYRQTEIQTILWVFLYGTFVNIEPQMLFTSTVLPLAVAVAGVFLFSALFAKKQAGAVA